IEYTYETMKKKTENTLMQNHPVIHNMKEKYLKLEERDPHETELLQAAEMLLDSLIPVFVKNNTYMEHNIIERLMEPERIITFRVPWEDDKGAVQVNRGFRVQFN